MASYLKSEICCPCCGVGFQAKRLKGWTQTQRGDLDGDPRNSAVFDEMLLCPQCGYAGTDMSDQVPRRVKVLVNSQDYQQLVRSQQVEQTMKKWLLAGRIYTLLRKENQAGDAYLVASWYAKATNQDRTAYLEQAVIHFSQYLEEVMDLDVALVLVDCLRLLTFWTEAEETVNSLLPYLTNPKMKLVARFEQVLIANQDGSVHHQDEVFK